MYTIEFVTEHNRIEYSKWVASIHFEEICDNLIRLMKGGRERVSDYGLPFVVSLVAAFESNLNDWLIIDTFMKHGPDNYEKLADGFISISIKNKYRAAVSLLTDNHFQINEDCPVVKDLDELIEVRNKFVHAKPRFYSKVTKHAQRPKKQRALDHPLTTLKIADCRRYLRSVKAYDRLFFQQYDNGVIKKNKLLRELEQQIGSGP